MIRWNEKNLQELVRRMKLRRTCGQGKTPIHLSLYGSVRNSKPVLTQIMRLDSTAWSALGYDETDRVSVTRYLGELGCRTDGAWSNVAYYQQPLTPELAKPLIDAGAFDEGALTWAACCQRPLTPELAKLLLDAGAFDQWALSHAAENQRPLTFELAKLLVDAGCDPAARYNGQFCTGWDSLVCLARSGHPVDPQVTDLFLSCGCRTNLDGCKMIADAHRLSFDQILKEHAEWKKSLS